MVENGKKIDAERKKEAISDYKEKLDAVSELKKMTDTKAWQKFYAHINRSIEEHGKKVLDAEQTREIVRQQEGVKILRSLKYKVKEPVSELNNFCHNMPLFAQEFDVRASWNDAIGKVELKNI